MVSVKVCNIVIFIFSRNTRIFHISFQFYLATVSKQDLLIWIKLEWNLFFPVYNFSGNVLLIFIYFKVFVSYIFSSWVFCWHSQIKLFQNTFYIWFKQNLLGSKKILVFFSVSKSLIYYIFTLTDISISHISVLKWVKAFFRSIIDFWSVISFEFIDYVYARGYLHNNVSVYFDRLFLESI